jgi:glycosyltransferase involved in cell wall biosynthesis
VTDADDQPRTALILVFNSVTHDSRVLREAATLRDLGFEISIVGVVSADEQETEARVSGFRVIRLTPVETLRRLWRSRKESRTDAGSGGAGTTAPTSSRNERRFAMLKRLVLMSAFYARGAVLVCRSSPALVHANDYNTMWVGIAAKLLRRSRLVYDSHELWPDQGRPEWRTWQLACEWLFLRLADATVAANPGISETIARRYRVPAPVVVRNLTDKVARQPVRAEGLRAGDPPLAVYVGGLDPERGIEQMILALALVPDLRLRLMGYGTRSDWYQTQLDDCAAAAGVADRIEYRAPVEPTAVPETIAGADMGIVLTQPTCLNNVQSLPNKLFEYIAAGLPVVASDLPVIGPLVREGGIGIPVQPENVAAIAAAMRYLSDPDRNAEVRDHVRAFSDRVNWQTERPALERVYAQLLDGRRIADRRDTRVEPS